MKYWSFIFLIFNTLLAVSQVTNDQKTIIGKVIEHQGGAVIGDAIIEVTSLNDSTVLPILHRTKPSSGDFELRIPSSYDVLIIKKIGYREIRMDISEKSGMIQPVKLKRTRRFVFRGPMESVKIKAFNEEGPIEDLKPVDSSNFSFTYQLIEGEISKLEFSKPGHENELFKPNNTQFRGDPREEISTNISLKIIEIDDKPFFSNSLSTAGKRNQSIGEIPASVVVITQDDIKKQGYATMEDVLENITGLYLFKDYSWSGGDPIIGVRGFFSEGFNDDIIILVNGVNQYMDYWGFYPFAAFQIPIEAIDKIEVVRGPMSVLYGSGAFFGAINIITNDPQIQEKFVATSYGSRDTRRIVAGADFSGKNLSVAFNAQLSDTDGVNQPFSRFLSDSLQQVIAGIDSFRTTTEGMLFRNRRYVNISAQYVSDDQRVRTTLDLVNGNENRGIFESTVATANDVCQCPIPEENLDARGSVNRTTNTYGKIGLYVKPINDSTSINLSLSYHNYRSSIDYNTGGNLFGFSTFLSRAFEGEASVSGQLPFDQSISYITGLNIRRADDLFTTFDIPSPNLVSGNNFIQLDNGSSLTLFSVFAEATKKIGKKLSILGGIRIEDLNDFEFFSTDFSDNSSDSLAIEPLETSINSSPVFIPRGAIVYKVNDYNYLKLLYGQATKRPSFGNFTDNPILSFPTIQTVELNYIREEFVEADYINMIINSSVYYNSIKDLISRESTVSDQGVSTFRSDNSRNINTLGAELGITTSFLRDQAGSNGKEEFLNVNLSTSFNNSREVQIFDQTLLGGIGGETDETSASYSPSFLGYFRVSYKPLTSLDIWLGLNSRYISSVSTPFRLVQTPNGQEFERLGEDVSGYAVTNFNIRAENLFSGDLLKGIYLNATATNLFDAEIQYPTTGNNENWAPRGSAGYGRRFLFTVGLKLD